MDSPPHLHSRRHSANAAPHYPSSADTPFPAAQESGQPGSASLPDIPQHVHGQRQEGRASHLGDGSIDAPLPPLPPTPPPPPPPPPPPTTETWMDFLQNVDGNNRGPHRTHDWQASGSSAQQRPAHPAHEIVEAARKRRLTAPDSPGRRPGYAQGGQIYSSGSPASHSGGALYNRPSYPGSSAANAIDLTSPQRRNPPMLPPFPQPLHRRISDIVLPPWQPDADVSKCPVCDTQFSFFYRKHHCRKCGRVVCANCSPHRITIPRQFIVQPPATNPIDLTGDDFHGLMGALLEGGEEVRVCNPCVPDPNLSPPTQPPLLPRPNYMPYERELPPPPPGASPPGTAQFDYSRPQYFRTPSGRVIQRYGMGSHEGYHYTPHMASNSLPPIPGLPNRATGIPNITNPAFFSREGIPIPSFGLRSPHRYTHSTSSITGSHYHPGHQPRSPPHPPSYPVPHSSSRAIRREIAESDECPVCGAELPPKGPDGSEEAREQHVQDCINSAFVPSSAPAGTTSAIVSRAEADDNNNNGSDSPGPTAAASGEAGSSDRPPLPPASGGSQSADGRTWQSRRRPTGTRMLVYRATEKDCIGDDGGSQECVICFEEFEQGDEMGRLECWCKFHRACIRKWWATKGAGSCPTHQLHD